MPAQEKKPKGPTAESTLGAIGDVAGLAGTLTGNDFSGLVAGAGGAGKEGAADDGNFFGFMGGWSNMSSAGLNIASGAERFAQHADVLGSAGNVLGGIGNGFGMITGTQDAFNEDKSGADRVVGGVDAVGNGLGLWGATGGFSLAASGGASVSSLAAAGGATAAGAAGAVLAAGVGGYKVGSVLNDIGNSDYARDSFWGQDQFTGEDRTATDALIDTMVDLNLGADEIGRDWNQSLDAAGASANSWLDEATGTDWVGDAAGGALDYAGGAAEAVMDYGGGFVGGVGTAVGSVGTTFMGVGTASANYVSSWFD